MNGDVPQRERALQVLRGEVPTHLPFITRLEAWFTGRSRAGTLPARFLGLDLDGLHAAVRVGRLKFTVPYALQLWDVDVVVTFNDELLYNSQNPLVENFPGLWDFVPNDRPGVTQTRLVTPLGSLSLTHLLSEQNILTGTDPYLSEHLIKTDADYRVVEHILERAEFVPLFERSLALAEQLGENAFVVPLLHRIPFQQVLLEYLGAERLFYALHDAPSRLHRLLDLLDQQLTAILEKMAGLDMPYLEFPDNLHGLMTNPRLFQEYCLPAYQKYTDILHRQGKKVGSHVDGDARPLLGLLASSGLDVIESFSPQPLTPCTFDEARQVWRDGPVIWGGIPSPWLEERTSEEEFSKALDDLFQEIDRPLILGVVDLFMVHNSIERVEEIARRVEDLKPLYLRSAGGGLS